VERIRVTGGPKVEASHKHHVGMPPFNGRHLWLVFAMFRVGNPARAFTPGQTQHLDLENLVNIEGPGCYYCEQVWHRAIGAHCPGPVGCTPACAEQHTYGPGCELEPKPPREGQ